MSKKFVITDRETSLTLQIEGPSPEEVLGVDAQGRLRVPTDWGPKHDFDVAELQVNQE